MSLPVVLRLEAEKFAAKVEEVLSRISTFPELYPALIRNVRAATLRRFPYLIYYRVQRTHVEVLAILHGSRSPRAWQRRVE